MSGRRTTLNLPARTCTGCGHNYLPRVGEARGEYERRRYCDRACASRNAVRLGAGDSVVKPDPGQRWNRIMRPVLVQLDDPRWRDRAACRDEDPEIFFGEPDPHGGDPVREAKAVCRRCPVRRDCLAWAKAAEVVGIWGGTTERERAQPKGAQSA